MLEFLKKETNDTRTENDALTYRSTLDECLDLFSQIGALRNQPEQEIIERFVRAFAKDRDLAMKILFYSRDIREGVGERRVFRVILTFLCEYSPESVIKNIPYIPEFGRFDDLLVLLKTPCEEEAVRLIKERLDEDIRKMEALEPVSLLAKWLPSVNASNQETVQIAKYLAKKLGLRDVDYRKCLSKLRKYLQILENNLREKDYSFDYEKQPSKAMFKYRRAFFRNDNERYLTFLEDVASGKAKLKTGTLMPYELIRPVLTEGRTLDKNERKAMDVTWNALEDFGDDENAIVVNDGSGSMYWSPAEPVPAAVSISLSIYFAQRNKGRFHNHFITFSTNPQLVEIKGRDIADRVRYCMSFNEIANTDISKVFELILDTAVKHKLPQSELPSTIYIISDMEFDFCAQSADITNFEYAKKRFNAHGYELPKLVFWNVCSRNRQQPVTMHEKGVVLVSGFTHKIFQMVMEKEVDPYHFMMSVINAQRYRMICA